MNAPVSPSLLREFKNHDLVDDIAMKKLLDGQFDECGLTLKQLDLIKGSLIKSLNAIYHGRVKYPGQQTA